MTRDEALRLSPSEWWQHCQKEVRRKRGDWERRYGAARRAADRKILEEAERALLIEAHMDEPILKNNDLFDLDARERIAKAFGRPM